MELNLPGIPRGTEPNEDRGEPARVRRLHTLLACGFVVMGLVCLVAGPVTAQEPSDDGGTTTTTGGDDDAGSSEPQVETLATGLEAPWGVAFLPDGSALVTERDSAKLLLVTASGETSTVATIDGVEPDGEGGLLGIAVSPAFDTDHHVYLYYTAADDNRIVRATYQNGELGEQEVILDGIAKGSSHDGGRIAFGPDGMLYAGVGEAGNTTLAQDRESLNGKILRMTPQGHRPPNNPFDSLVWSYGHRNVQGLTWDDAGRMYATEFGQETWDEVNLIEKGNNYGWPEVEGDADDSRFVDPLVTWSPADASPSGMEHHDGALWVAGLRGERLWRIPLGSDGDVGTPQALLEGEHGRLRTVATAPDGTLWVLTSNRDGRGTPTDEDDRILSLTPADNDDGTDEPTSTTTGETTTTTDESTTTTDESTTTTTSDESTTTTSEPGTTSTTTCDGSTTTTQADQNSGGGSTTTTAADEAGGESTTSEAGSQIATTTIGDSTTTTDGSDTSTTSTTSGPDDGTTTTTEPGTTSTTTCDGSTTTEATTTTQPSTSVSIVPVDNAPTTAPSGGSLARTGSNSTASLTALGVGLLLAGIVLVVITRTRRLSVAAASTARRPTQNDTWTACLEVARSLSRK